jgi:hypothetical protein
MLPDEDDLPRPRPSWSYAAALAVLVVTGYLSPLLLLVALPLGSIHAVVGFLAAAAAFVGWLVAIVRTHRKIREKGDQPWRKAADILVLGVLPAWGLVYALLLADADCIDDQCGGPTAYRPFAATHVFGLVALHAALSLAYAISRRRSEALRPAAELTILSSFVVGIVVHAAVAIQFGGWLALGLVFPPVFLPCLAPLLAILFFGAELLRRLRLRGRDAMLEKMIDPKQSKYRDGERHLPEVPLASAPVHRVLLAKALGLSPVLLGVHFVIQGLWHGRPLAALEVLTKTCGYTLSQIPIEVVPANCHYLCTVAARGHRGLVRPERIGKRGGVPILVNRQLAIANAFEDLLHERWPRFGRLARRTYDALGLPVSRDIRGPWLADAVYLVMKPAEWAFYAALLLLDRRSPEARIDRMYR